jgi:hypothetical protein
VYIATSECEDRQSFRADCWRKYRPRRSGWQELHDTNSPGKDGRSWTLDRVTNIIGRRTSQPSTSGKHSMDNTKWTFGLTMMIVGMGGTFLTLWVLSLVMDALKKVFPLDIKAAGPEKK